MEAIFYSEDGNELSRQVREFLHRHGVSYAERNVSQNPNYGDELAWQDLGQAPVVIVFGTAVQGFRPDALRDLLDLDGKS